MTNEELVQEIQSGNDVKNNLGILYEQNRRLIFKIVFPFSKMAEIDDLMQEAYFGLVKAVEQYDASDELKFISYLGYHIRNSMREFLQTSRSIRIPAHIVEKVSKYYSVVNEYTNENGENPSDEYIADKLGINAKQYKSLQHAIQKFSTVSFDDPIPGEDNFTVGDTLADKGDTADEAIDNVAMEKAKSDIWKCVDTLDEKTRKLVYAVYKDGMTEIEYAKEKGISCQAASKRMRDAYKLLKKMDKMKECAEIYGVNSLLLYHDTFSFFKYNGMSAVEYSTIKRIEYENGLKKLNNIFDRVAWGL